MDAYDIEEVLRRARAAVKDSDASRVEWTIYHMLETLLQDAADNAAARALSEHHAKTHT